jgi:tRNA(Ile)-lysidine synthetase-like protein
MPSSGADPIERVVRTVRAAIAEERLLPERGRCLVAVSGGADSTCLLDVLVRLHGPARLVVVHVDHGFRPDSARDADQVAALAARLGVACEVVRVDGPSFAREHRLGLEMAGRVLRYETLARVAAERRASRVATGHTRDDSAESVLMHLIRGSGLAGLRGIPAAQIVDVGTLGPAGVRTRSGEPASRVHVIRPLLRVGRADTGAYCHARGLAWAADPTNDDPRHLRNRVRHHLLPVLRTYNPAVDAALERTATLLRDDAAWIERYVRGRWRQMGTLEHERARIDATRFRRQPTGLQRHLVRHAVSLVGTDGETLTLDAIERALGVAAPDGPPRAQLGGGLVAVRSGAWLEIRREGVEPT